MSDLKKNLELFGMNPNFADRTYRTERGVRRFLATLNPGQLAEAEVLVDEDCFIVFYPLMVPGTKGKAGGYHYDQKEPDSGDPAVDTKQNLQQGGNHFPVAELDFAEVTPKVDVICFQAGDFEGFNAALLESARS